MNLVQINERLKDLPMQVIQQYANGMNPEVPPYLALGELQRRETAQKQMATAQGGMSGPQPSIKEQIEQKSGLMAAQGLQQQQMMQQMAQPRGPMPASEGTPQPEAQPTMTAARGGLARAPVDFNFQHGGIVAFNGEDGSDVGYETSYERMTRKNREDAERPDRKKDNEGILKALALLAAPLAAAGDVVAAPVRGLYGMTQHGDTSMTPLMDARAKYLASSENAPAAESFAREMQPQARASSNSVSEAQATAKAGPRAAAPIADLKALAEQKQRKQAPRPMPAPVADAAPAAPAQPAPDSMDAMLRAQLAQAPKARTMEELLAEQNAARTGAGMAEPAGAAQMERLRKLQEQYDSSKPSGLDDLIRIFGQAGQYKGLSGLAPAYTANQDRKNAADLAMAQKMNELMGGVETTQRSEMKDVSTGALAGLGVDRAAGEAARKDKMQVLSQGRGNDLTAASNEANRKTQERGQDLQYKAQMAQVAATKEAREAGADNKTIVAAEAAYARDPEAAALKKQLENPILANNPTKAAAVIQRLRAIQASKYQQFGITLEGAPGAASPGGTTRMRFDAQGNPIK